MFVEVLSFRRFFFSFTNLRFDFCTYSSQLETRASTWYLLANRRIVEKF